MPKPVCIHPQRWMLGAGRAACRNCPLRGTQRREPPPLIKVRQPQEVSQPKRAKHDQPSQVFVNIVLLILALLIAALLYQIPVIGHP